ncbi:TonB-dependent receptor [Sphingopyxis fribergensis]|uniref:TonB-dependent receptor n=1 Tax=Sphingopyxis fribergensis TaxID=1515612 RepID=UPI0005805F33|nr:TonB-dependent receptor [Sphingopyxis fribergensis]
MTGSRNAIFLASAALIAVMPAPANAQTRTFNVPAQAADAGIAALGRQADIQIVAARRYTTGLRTNEVRGSMSVSDALSKLLVGTGLVVRSTGPRTFMVVPAPAVTQLSPASSAEASTSGSSEDSAEIVVTGSHIRGAPSISPVTSITREDARQSGQTDLGQIIRDLPQNFAGGQNPTISASGQGGFTNVSGSSALNLRGLGPDASLTLINGHRVAFDAISQGIDISAIPLAAIERIDVVADGASALYGSDAVAGVANITLRRDIDSIITSARLGAATDGGAVTRQYNIVAGSSWRSGGFMLAADYQDSSEITARQRSYTGNVAPDATLIPAQDQISLVTAGRQAITDAISFEFDGHYMHRSTSRCLIAVVASSCYAQGSVVESKADSWSVSPALKIELPSGWNARLSGTYSKSDTDVVTRVFTAGNETYRALPKYSNELKSVELSAEGSLFSLPGGEARLAVGVGYRSNKLTIDSRAVVGGVERTTEALTESRDVAFGYGELSLPLVAPTNDISFVNKLHIIGALRYEDHHDINRVTTPKLGLVYSPYEGIEFKGSWGKSFKVPNLYQTGQLTNAQLVPSSRYNPLPPTNLPVLYLFGGNPDLAPERATTWTASVQLTPAFLDGFKAEIGYFNIRYRNRVAAPVASSGRAFQPVYSEFIQLDPGSSDVLSAIDGITGVFTNLTTGAFNPDAVSAIFRNYLQNIAVQNLEGVDFSVSYRRDLGEYGQLSLKGSASYLDSTREIAPGLPLVDQAGIIFTPPHWRGRLGASWQGDNVVLSATATYVGTTEDNRLSPTVKVGSFTTLDAVATIRSAPNSGLFSNVEWQVGVQNLFNAKPEKIRATYAAEVQADSTNHSLYGRVINLTLTKKW